MQVMQYPNLPFRAAMIKGRRSSARVKSMHSRIEQIFC